MSPFIQQLAYTAYSAFKIASKGRVLLLVGTIASLPHLAFALPNGGVVTSGSASIAQSTTTTTVTQSTNKAVINWNSFNIASNETVTFNQPSSSSITLNRVVGSSGSVIDGVMNANGQVFLVNPNGVLISKSGSINTAGFLATTKSITDDNFINGNYTFTTNDASSNAQVVNMGTITIHGAGYALLAGNSVSNSGTMRAIQGTIHMVGADAYSINLNGNSLVSLTVNKSVVDALVQNSGALIADGGSIYLTANAANELLNSTVNNTGVVQARTIGELTGDIKLYANGGTTTVSGTLDASAPTSGNGGFIETSGTHVTIADSALITTKAANGSSGTWLIDPTDFTINSGSGAQTTSSIGATTLSNSLNSGSVTIQTNNSSGSDNGDINVNANVTWTSGNTLTLSAYRNININAILDASGGGKVSLLYGQGAVASSNTATYNFGLTNTLNSATGNNFTGQINLQAGSNFSTKLGSDGATTNYTVITSLGTDSSSNDETLQGMQGALSGNFVLGKNIDASATSGWNSGAGFNPIGNSFSSWFSGNFDGLGHTIDRLYINRNSKPLGLFGFTKNGNIIRNIGMTNVSIAGGVNSSIVGGLVGDSESLITNSYVTGSVSGSASWASVGGLVGFNDIYSSITNSYATASVSGSDINSNIGGLVGYNNSGTITNSYATGNVSSGGRGTSVGGFVGYNNSSIQNSYATGNVSHNGGTGYIGGFVGYNNSSIQNSYATGSVSDDSSSYTGGFAGMNWETITTSYATGSVSGGGYSGGFVGNGGNLGEILNSFWDIDTTGKVTSGDSYAGIIGVHSSGTPMNAFTQSTYSGFDFTNTWFMADGVHAYPTLRAFISSTPTPTPTPTQT